MNTQKLFVSFFALVVLAFAIGACGTTPQLSTSPNQSSASSSASNSSISEVISSAASTSLGATGAGKSNASSQASSTTSLASSSNASTSGNSVPVGAPSAATVLPGAIAKTRAATIFKATEEMAMDQVFGATKDKTTIYSLTGEFNGKDSHIRVGGTLASILNNTPVDSVEFTLTGGKAYVHGPASILGAPDNKWYIIPASSPTTPTPNPFDTFDQLFKSKLDYANFKYTLSVMNGVSCNIYQADKTLASDLWTGSIFSATGVNPVIDDGSVEMIACSDGYLHGLTINLSGHDSKDATKKGTAKFFYGFAEFDTKIAIVAPTDAVPALDTGGIFGPSTSSSSSSRASSASTSSGTPSANVNGSWKGATANDDSLSFTIDKNQVTFVSLNVSIQTSSCGGSTSISKSIDNTPVTNDSFTAKLESSSGGSFTLVGNFKSGFMSGTIQGTGKLPCDATDFKTTWTALNTSIVASSSSSTASTRPTATAVPTPTKSASSSSSSSSTASLTDPVAIVSAFFAAINAKNADAAIALVDNNVIFNIGKTSGLGKENLRAQLTTRIAAGITFTASEYDPFNGIVDFKLRASDGATYNNSSIILSNNKIQILTLQ